MAAKKTTAKAEPPPAPLPGMSASFHAVLAGISPTHRKYDHVCRGIAFAYNGKCITAEERDVLVCYVVAAWRVIPLKARADIAVYDATYSEEVNKHKRKSA